MINQPQPPPRRGTFPPPPLGYFSPSLALLCRFYD